MVGDFPQAQYQIPSGEEIAGSKMENLLRVHSHAAGYLYHNNFIKLGHYYNLFLFQGTIACDGFCPFGHV